MQNKRTSATGIGNKNSQRRKRSSRASLGLGPMQIPTNVRFKHKFRFTATSAASNVITDSTMLGACGGICDVTNSFVNLFCESVRIRKIEVWSAPASQGSNSTVSIDWVGFGNSPNVEVSDTTLSTARNAYISAIPPPLSLASFWQKATGTQVCTIVTPAGSIVDVSLDIILADQEVATISVAVATGVLAHIYYLALDGPTANNLVPVSLNTTH